MFRKRKEWDLDGVRWWGRKEEWRWLWTWDEMWGFSRWIVNECMDGLFIGGWVLDE